MEAHGRSKSYWCATGVLQVRNDGTKATTAVRANVYRHYRRAGRAKVLTKS